MADRGRDLKVSIISDTDKFDTSDASKDLEKLGKEALDASKDIETFGKDAETTARKVDSAFEKIAASSKSNLRKVDTDTDKAKKGLDDFSSEAGQSGKEAAASFSGGFDSITDFVQETAAQAFAGFGPIGAAAGIAAAAGIGFVVTKINEAKERVEELTASFLDLRKDGIDPAADSMSHLTDEMDAAQLSQWKSDADKLGLSYETLRDAFDGNAEAIGIVRQAMAKYNAEALAHANGQKVPIQQFAGLNDKLNETEQAYRNAADASAFLATQSGTAQEKTEDLSGALQGVSEDAADMAEAIDKGVDAVLKAQKKQLKATEDFEKNTQTVFDRLGQDAVDWALSQGEHADEAMQLLADAPVKKGKQIVENYRKLGLLSSQGNAQGILDGKPDVIVAAKSVHAAVEDALSKKVPIPTYVQMPNGQVLSTFAERVRRGIGTIDVKVRPIVGDVYIPNRFAMRPVP